MAVTKIRKVSSSTLLVATLISVLVIALFFFGGSEMEGDYVVYNFTDTLLYWTYALFGATLLATVFFAATKINLSGLIPVVGLIALFAITYSIGDGEPLTRLNEDAQQFNTSGWLKFTDAQLYTSYVLLALCILTAAGGALMKSFKK